ncbi:hypothetical protein [Terasakiella pusilla]|uniref:hypothetical protein n=1 Tax=Terasakiella pusilla TaxID=64973 RepID=UPI003AA7D9AD
MTVKTNKLENLAGDKRLDVDKIVDGSAKALVNYNGVAAVINKSVNVSSAVDVAVGTYGFNLTNAMADQYPSIGTSIQMTDQAYGNYYGLCAEIDRFTDPSPTSVQVICKYGQSAALYDCGLYSVAIHGDLA